MPLLFPYQDKDSRIHRLDARPKIVFVLSLFMLSILISDILYLAILFLMVMAVVAAAKVLRSTLGLMKYTVYVAIFIFVFSILVPQGSNTILDLGLTRVTTESLLFATSMCFRLFLVIGAFSILTFTVHPDKLLQTLSKYGFKSMTGLSIATRMYPTIAADSGSIEDAMKARGVEFDDGNVIKKAKARAPVIMPLLLNSMDRSMEIAEAMEARGFGAGKRTRYFDSPLTLRDKALIALFVAAIPFGVAMYMMGHGNIDYIAGAPLSAANIDILIAAAEALFFAPLLIGGSR